MLTFFATPKAFRGHIEVIQRNALQSWKLLHPGVEVIVLGNDAGAEQICRELELRHEPNIAVNPSGTKRLDVIFARAQEMASHSLMCYCNCDIVLTRDFRVALEELLHWELRFLMVGRRWDTDIEAPIDFSRATWGKEITQLAHTKGYQRLHHNIDYFVFPRGLYTQIPPLVIGRVGWDPWLVGKAHASGVPVVDVSERVCAVHQNHDYGYHRDGFAGVSKDHEARRNFQLAEGIRLMTIEDAGYRLTAHGVVKNRMYWLAPAKRRLRELNRKVRAWARTYVWHPVLDATRPVRRVLGLKQSAVPKVLRSATRRHSMD
jgi:hypothetical protein